MIRKLFIVAGSGFVLSVACIAGATALASHDIAKNGGVWTLSEAGDKHIRFVEKTSARVEPPVTKTLAWTGGERLLVDIPAEVVYTQGATPSVTINGDKLMTDRVRLENGRLFLADGPDVRSTVEFHFSSGNIEAHSNDALKIVITAPSVKDFEIVGSSDLRISAYDQPSLDLRISGSGSAEVSGRAKALKLEISGAGEADLRELTVEDADINISGSGDATIAPTGKVKVDVSGSGNVELATRPAQLDSKISGAGSVEQE
ncbi:MAG: DUF2807 domain-containing protein [Asticcacaulis sp.]